MTGFAHMSIEG